MHGAMRRVAMADAEGMERGLHGSGLEHVLVGVPDRDGVDERAVADD